MTFTVSTTTHELSARSVWCLSPMHSTGKSIRFRVTRWQLSVTSITLFLCSLASYPTFWWPRCWSTKWPQRSIPEGHVPHQQQLLFPLCLEVADTAPGKRTEHIHNCSQGFWHSKGWRGEGLWTSWAQMLQVSPRAGMNQKESAGATTPGASLRICVQVNGTK